MIKDKIIEIGKRLYLKNLTIGTSGNISIKTNEGIYITASGTALGNLSREDIVLIDDTGNEISEGKASSEKMLHVEIYKIRQDIKAIIHTHPVYLTTFASCHKALREPIMSENILYFEEIPVAEYAMPSSRKLVRNTVKYLKTRDVTMMANHGAIACANNIENAFLKMETAEYYAQVSLNTKIIGGAKLLSDNDVLDLINLKNNIH
ncbi:class II aldolase/adducin family protein [bacterium]|nr:class II aldolase/adducin family protein [bacterium]